MIPKPKPDDKALPLARRFWRRVRTLSEIECWPWTGATHKGYGRIRVNGVNERAHRVAWTLTRGPIPDGMHVCHRCDNEPCCNPLHLFLGTAADNAKDRTVKGRSRGGRLSGMRHPQAKLSDGDVKEIRKLRGTMSQADIGRRYGVSQTTIGHIFSGQNWGTV